MADTLSFRKADGSTTTVANNTTISLDHTVASIDLAVIVDQPGLDQGEVRGWISESPTKEGPFVSGQYGLTIFLEQGQSKSVLIKTVQAHTLANLSNSIFEKVVDTFTITVTRDNAPADSVTDSVPINFLVYPDSQASLAIVNASFNLLDSSGFDIVDSPYIRNRQNRNFDFLINLPKSIDSVGITRSLFDSDVRKSTSVTDAGGDGSLTYNDSTGVITYTGPSAAEVRAHLSAGGDLSYNQATGQFSFDVEQVYTKANFDSDFNLAMDDVVIKGDGLKYNTTTNELEIDSAELSSFFRQDIRGYISGTDAGGDGSFSYNATTGVITYTGPSAAEVRAHFTGNKGLIYNSSTGNFDVDSANLRTIISATDAGGDGSFSYNNATGVFTYTGPSASEVRSHFSGQGDLTYDSATGVFQFDVEQVYTKENFDSDFNLTLDSAVLEGFGLKYDNNTNTLSIDSSELQSYFRQDIRSYISADKGLVYNSTTGNFDVDSANLRTIISGVDAGGDGSFSYNSSTGVFTYTGPSAAEVRAHLSADKGLVYNASTGNFDVDSANLRTIISATDAGGDGSFVYNNSTGVFTYTGPSATEVRNHFTGGTGIAISSGDIKIDSSELTSLYRQTIRTYLNVIDAGGDGSFAYDSTLGKFTYTGPSASEVRAHLTANKGLSVSSGEFNIDSANVRGMLSGGTGVTYTAGSGVIAIGQPVATTDSVTFAGMTVSGNLQVTGTTTTVNSTTLDVADKNITIAKGAANAAAADGGGITVDGAGATLTYAATGDKFVFNKPFEGSFLGADSNFDASLATKTTTNLAEGNNLYYTTARADSAARSALIAVDAGGDGSFTYDSATGKFTYTGPSAAEVRAHFTGGAGIGLASGDIKIDSSELYSLYKHDDFADFVADEHVAHSGVSVIAGTGLTGGGDITTSKTLNVIGGKGIIANADDIQIDSTNIKGMLAATDAGGDGSFAYNNSTGVFTYTGPSASEVRAHFTGGTGITYNAGTGEFTTTDADIVHDNLSGFVADEHVAHSGVSIIAGKGLSGGGTIASSRTLNIDSANVRSMFSAGGDLSYNSGTGQFSFDVEQVYTKANFDSDFNVAIDSATTSDLSEGTNLYYTNARADARVNLQTGTNLDLSQKSTSDLSEGSNLYFTNERVDDRVGALITGGVNVTATYDDAAGTLEIKVPFENIDDRVGAILTGGSGIDVNYDDPNATITITNTLNTSDFTDSAFVTGLPISTFTNDANYLDSTYASALIDSAHIKAVVDSAYVQLIQADLQRDSGFISQVVTGGTLNMGANNIITTGKVLFANVYSQLSDLPSASTYHGMFAHVHGTGKAYYAHAGAWVELANNSQLSNSSNWDTAFGWGDHSAAGYQSAATALDSAMVYRFTIDSTRTSALVDAAYVQARQIQYNTSDFLDSTTVTGVVDAAYVQARQTSYNTSDFTDSAFVTGLPISTFTNDANYLDSTTITGVVNNAYVRARQALIDSDLTKLLVDSAYIQLRDRFQDSSLVTSTIDSSYVQLKVPETYLSTIIDSAYVTARAGIVLDSASIASGVILTTVDDAYVQARQIQYNTSDFLDSTTVFGVIDSAYLLNTGFTVAQATKVYVDESEDDNVNYNITFVETNPGGNSHSSMQVDNGGLTFNPSTNTLVSAGNITASSNTSSVGGRLTLQTADVSIFDGNQLGTIQFKAVSELSGGDATAVAAEITAEADATFTSSVNSTDLVFKLGTSGAATEKARLTHEGNFSATSFSGDGSALTGITAGLDSALTSQLIDSAYIALRTTSGTDSATVIGLIDSDYVSSRVVAFANPIFTEFKYVTDSAGQIVFEGNDANGNALSIETGNHSVFVNGIRLLPSDFTSDVTNNRITLDSTGAADDEIVISTIKGKNALAGIAIIDSDYISSRTIAVANPQFNNFRYIATSNQTAFTGADVNSKALSITTSNFQVFLNGIRLLDSDFTADTDNNTITLSSGATASDELVVTTVIGQTAIAGIAAVDSAYVQARVASGTDSSTVISLINSTVNTAYVTARQSLLDSDLALQLLLDSSEIVALIDSAYINARVSTVDSAQVLGIVDSDYIATALPGVVAPRFTNFQYVADSGDTTFNGADINGNILNLRTGNHSVFLNGIKLLDSDFTSNIATDTITLASSANNTDEVLIQTITGDVVTTGTIIDSSYVQLRQEGVNATFKDFKFVATANQTVFSGNDANGTALSFEANKFHVLLNGIRLDASDFTESAANNKITLATGATVSDELIVSTIGTEKTTTLASITSTVDSAYVQARQADIFRDSAFITGIVDSAYVQAIQTDIFRDSAYIANIVDSALGTINVIGPSGPIVIGSSTPDTTISGGTPAMQVVGSGLNGTQSITRRDNGQYGPSLMLAKSRNTTPGSNTIVQDGDTLGGVIFIGDDGTDLDTYGASITAQVNGTPGANDMPTSLHFNINRGTNTPYEAFRVNHFTSTDNFLHPRSSFGWNTTGGNQRNVAMHVSGHRYYFPAMALEDYDNATAYAGTFVLFYRNNTHAGSITSTSASSVSYGTSSDYRMKSNVADLDSAINIVKSLKPKKFKWKSEDSADYDNPFVMGFIAHEADSAIPLSQGIVIGDKDDTDSHGTPKMQSMDYGKMTPLVVKALQEALEKIETLEAKVAALEGGE